MLLRLDEANKLAQELSYRKKELKADMFGDKLALFDASPSIGETSLLGELTFTHIQLPFAKLNFASSELTPVNIRSAYDFLVPLEHGERIVAFKVLHKLVNETFFEWFTVISCSDRLGLNELGRNCDDILKHIVQQENVVQCGPSEFVVCHQPAPGSRMLSVYNSKLTCLRYVDCKSFSNICCNSKFVFGLWNSDDDDDDERFSGQRIQVHHLDTLSEAFELRVPKKYTVERIYADEHHLVALCLVGDIENQWYMSVFDLATCNQIDGDERARFFLSEGNIDLEMERLLLEEVCLLDGWLVVPTDNAIFWYDKTGTRSETSTELNNQELQTIYASRSILLFAFNDRKVLMKRW